MTPADPPTTPTARHTLLIPLVGPLQAWGSRSRFDDRDTHPEPTKSGVLGMVCAALGRGRGEPLEDLRDLRFGVRVDEPGRLVTDFHTAQEVIRAGGSGTTTVTSRRHYLAGAGFLAGLEAGEDALDLLRAIEAALRNPVWPLALGRKSCPPAVPPYFPAREGGSIREGRSLEEALLGEPWRPLRPPRGWERRPEQLRTVFEEREGAAAQADQPLDFGARRFGLRRVTTKMTDRPKEERPWSIYPS